MKKNIGRQDKIIRAIIALALFATAYWLKSWIALIIALFVVFEVATSWCLFYQLIGKNSCIRK